MRIIDIATNANFNLLTKPDYVNKEINNLFASDLLSFAMGNLEENDVFLTIIANRNALAIANLLNLSCIIVTSNIIPDDKFIKKANEENIVIFKTELDTARAIIELNEKVLV